MKEAPSRPAGRDRESRRKGRPVRVLPGLAASLWLLLPAPAAVPAAQPAVTSAVGSEAAIAAGSRPADKTPAPAATLDLVHEIHAAGLHVGTVQTRIRMAAGGYAMETRAETSGLADSLVQARLVSRVRGRMDAQGLRPEHFETLSDTRFGTRELAMRRNPDGRFHLIHATPALDPRQQAALASPGAVGALDPLTAAIHTSLAAADGACAKSLPVFDGRRTFRLEFSPAGEDSLAAGAQARFTGDAIKCHVRYVPLAGQSRAWRLAQLENPSPPASLWLAPVETRLTGPMPQAHAAAGEPALLLPVRMEIAGAWGRAVIHLTQARLEGRDMLAGVAGNSSTGGGKPNVLR